MEIRKLGIIGGGRMGKSIAEKVASSGIDVMVLETSKARAQNMKKELESDLDEEIQKWGITESEKRVILKRVNFVDDIRELTKSDVIIEAIPEDLQAKRKVLSQMEKLCPAETVFMTNTATLSITDIASGLENPERLIGVHFMYPVTWSPIVEVVRGMHTSDETFECASTLTEILGKEVIEVFETPGYVTTRGIVPLLNEAIHMVMEGVASTGDVDKAMRLGYEFKAGPLEFCDRVGLDKVLEWMEHLFQELGDFKYRPCPLLRKKVRAGHLGRRCGRGFFDWSDPNHPQPFPKEDVQ